MSTVGVVGAGIVGLSHAWSAAKRGHLVTVFERGPAAVGASVRNFGMVWPIGQAPGEPHAIALASQRLWLELAREAGLWVNACGSIHLARRDDEMAVLEEFAAVGPDLGYDADLLTPDDVLRLSPGAHPDGVHGGLYSLTELGVNPRAAIPGIADWLARRFGVRFHFNTAVTSIVEPGRVGAAVVEPGRAHAADGSYFLFDRLILCNGTDFQTLFPGLFRDSGLRRCKLQMLRTVPQPGGWRLGPHLAGGLTLRHYANFQICKSLDVLRGRIMTEAPELDRFGIHVMASQNDAGEVILGDSHEYDEEISPFDKPLIDDLILRELRRLIRLPDWTIAERWHGVYAKHPTELMFEAEPLPGVHVRTATGGAGMTLAFGLAERSWEHWS